MNYPKIVANLAKIQANAKYVLQWCSEHGVSAAFVGKCVGADFKIVSTVLKCGFAAYADSREENLRTISSGIPRMLLRIGMPDRADEIVNCSDISLQSELATIQAIAAAARSAQKKHRIILMLDVGDLREGLFYLGEEAEKEKILHIAKAVVSEPYLELYGIGTNLTCYGSIVPDEDNLGKLVEITKWLREKLNREIPVIAGGNSSTIGMMRDGNMPVDVNFLRLGEVVLLGTNTATGVKFPELYDDTFILEAELVEVQVKPSVPIGVQSVNAFGEKVKYEEKGNLRRGILAIGRQDTQIDGLTPIDTDICILGGSSDHLIIDLTAKPDYKIGDIVQFKLSYGALLAAYTSKYVNKDYR